MDDIEPDCLQESPAVGEGLEKCAKFLCHRNWGYYSKMGGNYDINEFELLNI